jgi:hypothetical protein
LSQVKKKALKDIQTGEKEEEKGTEKGGERKRRRYT